MNLNRKFHYVVDFVGKERQPVLVVDNFLDSPEMLVDYCIANNQFNKADAFYPGVRSPAPRIYVQSIYQHLRELIYDTFSLQESMIKTVQSDFSMVLTPPSQLKAAQCMPHFDSLNGNELASVHYLCARELGGTSLYRHRNTGYESVDQARLSSYSQSLNEALASAPYPQAYMNGDNHLFERIASYEAVYNRIIFYRCTCLHSGDISHNYFYDSDPGKGRLTINTFIGA